MPAPYSNDFRQKVIDAHQDKEGGYRTLARRFRVSRDFVRELVQHHAATGDVAPNPRQNGPSPKLEGERLQAFAVLVEQHNDATLNQLVVLIRQGLGLELGKSSVDRALKRLGITRKKNAPRYRA
jgi:transposase